MSKAIAMVDVDSTLADSQSVLHSLAKDLDIDWPENPQHWVSTKQFNIQTMRELFDVLHCEETVSTLTPYAGAQEALHGLSERLEYWYVSDRDPVHGETLTNWLNKWNFPDADNVYVSFDKLKWIDENRPDMVVDDRVRTLVHSHFYYEAQCYGLLQPWNINLSHGEIPGITICPTWYDLGAEIEGGIEALV